MVSAFIFRPEFRSGGWKGEMNTLWLVGWRANWKQYLSLSTSNAYDKGHLQDSMQVFTVEPHMQWPRIQSWRRSSGSRTDCRSGCRPQTNGAPIWVRMCRSSNSTWPYTKLQSIKKKKKKKRNRAASLPTQQISLLANLTWHYALKKISEMWFQLNSTDIAKRSQRRFYYRK